MRDAVSELLSLSLWSVSAASAHRSNRLRTCLGGREATETGRGMCRSRSLRAVPLDQYHFRQRARRTTSLHGDTVSQNVRETLTAEPGGEHERLEQLVTLGELQPFKRVMVISDSINSTAEQVSIACVLC